MHYAFASFATIHPYSPQQVATPPFGKPNLQKKKQQNQTPVKLSCKAASVPSFTKQQSTSTGENPLLERNPNPSGDLDYSVEQSIVGSCASCKWRRENESALSTSEALPLPMTYPDSAPSLKDVEDMKNCDPEIKDCRDVIYQWTGECSRCQGTGDVNYHKGNGREVIAECMNCLGLGHVNRVTMRTDIERVEGLGVA